MGLREPGRCTLRAALAAATASGQPTTIVLPTGTFPLGGTPLVLPPTDVTITGASTASTVIDGGRTSRVLELSGGRAVLADLTLTGGFADQNGGGAVFATATDLTLTRVAVTGNGAT